MVSQNAHPQSLQPLLCELASLYGVQTGYRDSLGRRQTSPSGSVLAALCALGAQIEPGGESPASGAQLKAAIEAREAELRGRLVEPVVVAWDGVLPQSVVPASATTASATYSGDPAMQLTLESGEVWFPSRRGSHQRSGSSGSGRSDRPRLPFGYHRLRVGAARGSTEATVISAPRRCWSPDPSNDREWGIFAPLYSLRSDRDWGAGDLADLEDLRRAVAEAGGTAVATLPLLASYLGDPFEPAPYRPVSRLFWNEFYLAVDRIAEWEQCGTARELWESADVQAHIARSRAERLVDYRHVMAVKQPVLEELCRWFFERGDASRKAAFAEYVRTHADAGEYATFRALMEGAGEDVEEVRRYHLYCQWQLDEQLGGFGQNGASGLFLDMPVGVHPRGFDTWRWPELFARDMSIGAPPDGFFAYGQDWDTPPLLPERSRQQGHRYFRECVRHHMQHARYLRIDHVMALHRLFWIPEGSKAADGVYVGYPAEELYAVLCLESQRSRTVVVGEDLGTVPPEVRPAMGRRGVLGTWMLQSSLRPRAAQPLGVVPRRVSAGLGTHDMYPFAAFVRGDDIIGRQETGQVDAAAACREIAARRRLVDRLAASLSVPWKLGEASADLLSAVLAHLLSGAAAMVVINLDDLLLETRPQNRPGTGAEENNWRCRVAASQEEVRQAVAAVAGLLADRGDMAG